MCLCVFNVNQIDFFSVVYFGVCLCKVCIWKQYEKTIMLVDILTFKMFVLCDRPHESNAWKCNFWTWNNVIKVKNNIYEFCTCHQRAIAWVIFSVSIYLCLNNYLKYFLFWFNLEVFFQIMNCFDFLFCFILILFIKFFLNKLTKWQTYFLLYHKRKPIRMLVLVWPEEFCTKVLHKCSISRSIMYQHDNERTYKTRLFVPLWLFLFLIGVFDVNTFTWAFNECLSFYLIHGMIKRRQLSL